MRPAAAFVGLLLVSGRAWGGGFEIPDNGTEALGRGGAFTAKADDPTALEYNVAGFASQRGTRILLDAHSIDSKYTFQRAGLYPGNPSDPTTPWAGKPFPLVSSQTGFFVAPFVVVSSDFGLDRFTFALGAYGPSGVGQRTYPLGVHGEPSPARYDSVQSDSIIALPTAAVATRVTDWLDVGVALHLVTAIVNNLSVSTTDSSSTLCPSPEYRPCDSLGHLHGFGVAPAASLGAMLRPAPWLALGLDVRSGATIVAKGTLDGQAPQVTPTASASGSAQTTTHLPWVVRAGARLVAHEGSFESGDLEVDGTYEAWHAAEGVGDDVYIPQISVYTDIDAVTLHHYEDTFSVRAGGARNFRALGGVVSLRAGGYYDSSATHPADTRLDFDTLAKLAVTGGLGFRRGAWGVNAAYAEIFAANRTVTDGDIRPINGAMHGQAVDGNGQPLPAVNDGVYASHNRIFSLSLELRFDRPSKP